MHLSLKLIIYFFPLLTCQTKTYHVTPYVDGSILIVLNIYSSGLKVVQNWIDGLPWWLSVKESATNVGDTGSIPGQGRSHMLRNS